MNIEEYKEILKSKLSEKRYNHCINVSKKAVELSLKYGVNEQHAMIAGLLHDITKELSEEEHIKIFREGNINLEEIYNTNLKLWHAKSAAVYVNKHLGISDEDILNAIKYHTTGRKNMSTLEKIIYISDAISEERTYNDVDKVRKAANENLDLAMVLLLALTIKKLINNNMPINEDTFKAYNELINKI